MPTRRRLLALGGVGVTAGLTGCAGDGADADGAPDPDEVTVTVRLRNRDDARREYRIAVRQGGDDRTSTYSMEGVLGADERVEGVATFRPTEGDRHEVTVGVEGAQRGHAWDPFDCADYLVEAAIETGAPTLDGECREE